MEEELAAELDAKELGSPLDEDNKDDTDDEKLEATTDEEEDSELDTARVEDTPEEVLVTLLDETVEEAVLKLAITLEAEL